MDYIGAISAGIGLKKHWRKDKILREDKGILLSCEELIQLSGNKEKCLNNLAPKIKTLLQNDHENKPKQFYFQYSHDKISPDAAQHFLETHRIYIKNNNRSQNVLMLGKNCDAKKDALNSIKEKLIHDGFQRISFYNADLKEEEVIYDSGVAGKDYRVIYTSELDHPSIMSCIALSEGLVGTTGDQSFGEGLSSDNLVMYEWVDHKCNLFEDYQKAIQNNLLSANKGITAEQAKEIANLLIRVSPGSSEDYNRLESLMTPEQPLRGLLQRINKAIIKNCDLSEYVFNHKEINMILKQFQSSPERGLVCT